MRGKRGKKRVNVGRRATKGGNKVSGTCWMQKWERAEHESEFRGRACPLRW